MTQHPIHQQWHLTFSPVFKLISWLISYTCKGGFAKGSRKLWWWWPFIETYYRLTLYGVTVRDADTLQMLPCLFKPTSWLRLHTQRQTWRFDRPPDDGFFPLHWPRRAWFPYCVILDKTPSSLWISLSPWVEWGGWIRCHPPFLK